MEYCANGRGALRTKKLRRANPVPTMRTRTITAMAAVPNLCSLAAVAMAELPEEYCGMALALGVALLGVAPLADAELADRPLACADGISRSDARSESEVRCRPELVSRFRRFKSARISAALW